MARIRSSHLLMSRLVMSRRPVVRQPLNHQKSYIGRGAAAALDPALTRVTIHCVHNGSGANFAGLVSSDEAKFTYNLAADLWTEHGYPLKDALVIGRRCWQNLAKEAQANLAVDLDDGIPDEEPMQLEYDR